MDVRKIRYKRPLKLLTLLVTSMLIATASAAVYYSMNMQPTVTISQATVIFEEGTDWPGGSMGTNSTYVSLTIKAYPNATLTYDEPLKIKNTDLSSAHNVRLRHISITPASGSASVSNFTFIDFTLNSVDFDYTTTGDAWNTPSDMAYQSLPANTAWAVKIETKAAAGATDALTCTIVIAVDVQE